ncbi:hypothetical protein [Polyangium aurulentum]|uniref:hypothetical protein n=1 Tax=Polyangium aurulentum TaxID=2567896 RepID=UPI0010AE7FFC|nr:hypothetical protein [Polyangium aurulentum]UQA61442.1 hypothetical protein E8A73_013580 [Polyangium aurulentum]
MKQNGLASSDAGDIKLFVAVLRNAKRDYRAALKRIQSRETFLARHLEGLGYEGERLYASDSFEYPPRAVIYNGGLSRIVESHYMLSFAKDDTGWHFWIAPTTEETGEGTLILSDRAKRLLDAPAGLVLRCAQRIEKDVTDILDQVASIVSTCTPMRKAGKKSARRAGAKTGGPPPKEDLH